jgi:hypothetical protein
VKVIRPGLLFSNTQMFERRLILNDSLKKQTFRPIQDARILVLDVFFSNRIEQNTRFDVTHLINFGRIINSRHFHWILPRTLFFYPLRSNLRILNGEWARLVFFFQ